MHIHWDLEICLTVCKMDKKLMESFAFSIIAFLGIGIGFFTLVLFLLRGRVDIISIAIPIFMILFGLFGVVNLFSEK